MISAKDMAATESRRTIPRPPAALLVFGLSFTLVAVFTSRQRMSYDGFVMAQVAASIVDHGTPLVHPIDGFGLNTPYSGYGIGTSLVMGGLYKLGDLAGADPVRALQLTDSLLYAATITGIFVLLRRLRFAPSVVVGVTALFALGTPLLAYALSDFSEPGVALMVVLALVGLDAVAKGSLRASVAVGAALGGAVLFRTDSWLLVVGPMLAALWLLAGRRWRPLVLAGYGLAPFAAVWMAYNAARFGSPLSTGYSHQPFSHPLWSGLYGLALSPGRGVFVYVPVLLLGLVALRFQRGPALVVGALAVGMLAMRLVFYARWWFWSGGAWGPRFMVPILPVFAPLVADATSRWRRHPLLYIAAGAGVALSTVGFLIAIGRLSESYQEDQHISIDVLAATPPQERGRRLVDAVTADDAVEANDRIMFDWTRFPARAASRRREAPAG